MEVIKNESDRKYPIQYIDAEQFFVTSKEKSKEASQTLSVKRVDEGHLFLELNSVLVRFWKENDVRDNEVKVRLMNRMLNWYRNMGYVTLDSEGWHPLDGRQSPKWVYRLEFKDDSCGLWYNGKGGWCFEEGIGSLSDECKTKTLPMDYDWRYKQDGRDWFSACSKKEDLMHWYSLEDAKTLIDKGFVFTRYLATEYHEYDLETVFIKETALKREEIDIFELFGAK